MDLAEDHIRNAGYGGFSFRDLAAEIGIKSASVHHHFPTKATMAAAVARRYGDRFLASVARRLNETADDAIRAYRAAFREGLQRDGRMCLCGVLGAEAGVLSADVAKEMLSFFRRCIDDLSQRIGGPDAEARALQIMATLEGAVILDTEAFDQAAGGPRVPQRRRTQRNAAASATPVKSERMRWLEIPG
jgi:TetR/AcrR family transcriptional repressor of nem operon